MQYKNMIFQVEEGIATIMINRPDKLNALNSAVFDELESMLDEVAGNAGIRSAIITGSGDKAFVAGADISEFTSLDARAGEELSRRGQLVFDKIENSSKVIIAAVNGYALGGGCELAMACHIRVAADHAKFGQPEVNLGLLPGYGGTQRLVQLVGKGRALELLATGNMIDAITAFNYGLVNHVVAGSELMRKARSLLSLINSKAPLAVAACIKAAQLACDPEKKGYLMEAQLFGELLQTKDSQEGVAAFLEKRRPVFNGN